MNIAIILAGGKSERYKGNKLFELIDGEFLIEKTINIFLDNKNIDKVILAISEIDYKKITPNKKVIVSEPGIDRFTSVKNALKKIDDDSKKILIHDGARPFISNILVNKVINELERHRAVLPVLKISDCIKEIKNNKLKTKNRENFVLSQTPQGFHYDLIKDAYESTIDNYFDDAQLIELKYPDVEIKLIEGDAKNIKITYKDDMLSHLK